MANVNMLGRCKTFGFVRKSPFALWKSAGWNFKTSSGQKHVIAHAVCTFLTAASNRPAGNQIRERLKSLDGPNRRGRIADR